MTRTKHKQIAITTLDSVRFGDSPPWVGRGKVRAARLGEALFIRIDAVTSQTRVLKGLARDFFRGEMRARRPDPAGLFEVEIAIETTPQSPRLDVDNVAKALLDALTGVVFRDDGQVARLVVERHVGERPRIWARAAPIAERGGSA